MSPDILTSINLFVLTLSAVGQSYVAWRCLRTTRTTMKITKQTVDAMLEMRDLMLSQQQDLRAVHKAALFWYMQWLQEVGKR